MKFIVAFLCALALAGCATLDPTGRSILQGGTSITAPITNPIGPDQLYEAQAAYDLAARVAVVYFRLRQCRRSEVESFTNPCSRRAMKVKLQALDQKALDGLAKLRTFVANKDQVSAVSLAKDLYALLLEYKSEAAVVTTVIGVK